MSNYQLQKDGSLLKDGSAIPADERNADYREYLAWVAAGNEAESYVEYEPSYADKRRSAYPSLADQLDMIYWDGVNGTTQWADMIKSVKEAYPK